MTYGSEDYWYGEYLNAQRRLSDERRDHRATELKLARAREDLAAAEATNAALQQSVNELSARLDGDRPEPLIFLPIKKYNVQPAQPEQPFELGDVVQLHREARTYRIINIKFEDNRWQLFLWGMSTWYTAEGFVKVDADALNVGDIAEWAPFNNPTHYRIIDVSADGLRVRTANAETGEVYDTWVHTTNLKKVS